MKKNINIYNIYDTIVSEAICRFHKFNKNEKCVITINPKDTKENISFLFNILKMNNTLFKDEFILNFSTIGKTLFYKIKYRKFHFIKVIKLKKKHPFLINLYFDDAKKGLINISKTKIKELYNTNIEPQDDIFKEIYLTYYK